MYYHNCFPFHLRQSCVTHDKVLANENVYVPAFFPFHLHPSDVTHSEALANKKVYD